MPREDWNYRRGDIYMADLGERTGSEQDGVRPVIVLQNDVGNFFSPTVSYGSRKSIPGEGWRYKSEDQICEQRSFF